MKIPAWIPCGCCDEFYCTIHGVHAFECDCPEIELWGDVDPYSPCVETIGPVLPKPDEPIDE